MPVEVDCFDPEFRGIEPQRIADASNVDLLERAVRTQLQLPADMDLHGKTHVDDSHLTEMTPAGVRKFSEVSSASSTRTVCVFSSFPRPLLPRNFTEAVNDFMAYMDRALSADRLTLKVACAIARAYSSTGDAVVLHPDFPKKPLSKDQALEAELYVGDLSDFLSDNEDLSSEQVQYVRRKIKRWQKKVGWPFSSFPLQYAPEDEVPAKKAKSKEFKSAFDFWVLSLEDLSK